MRYNEGERIAVVDDRSFGSEDHAIIAELRSLLNARSETESKKALEPISVLTVAITIVAAKLVDGFVGQIGGDVWGAAKDKMKVLFRRKRNSPAHLLIVAATIDVDGDRRPVEVIRSDASDQDFDALRGEIIDETIQAAAVAVKSSPYLIGLSSHIREETAFGTLRCRYQWCPFLFDLGQRTPPEIDRLSVGGSARMPNDRCSCQGSFGSRAAELRARM